MSVAAGGKYGRPKGNHASASREARFSFASWVWTVLGIVTMYENLNNSRTTSRDGILCMTSVD